MLFLNIKNIDKHRQPETLFTIFRLPIPFPSFCQPSPYLPAIQGSLKIYIPNKQNQFPLLFILVTIAHFF